MDSKFETLKMRSRIRSTAYFALQNKNYASGAFFEKR